MNAGFRFKASAIWLWGLLLALAGALLVLQLAALLLWQYNIALEKRAWPGLPLRILFDDHSRLAAKAVAPFLQFIPELRWTWIRDAGNPSLLHAAVAWVLGQVHIGVVPALLGVPIALSGVGLMMRQRFALASAHRDDEDRLRRAREYRKQPQEPSIDPGVIGDDPDLDLIEAAEQAWRRDRMKVLRR